MAPVGLQQLCMELEADLPAAEQAMQQAERWLSCRDQHKDLMVAAEEVLNTLRDEWELSTIRKTTLFPNTFIQGRVYFPFRTNTKYIKIYAPLKDDLLTFVFLVEKHSI